MNTPDPIPACRVGALVCPHCGYAANTTVHSRGLPVAPPPGGIFICAACARPARIKRAGMLLGLDAIEDSELPAPALAAVLNFRRLMALRAPHGEQARESAIAEAVRAARPNYFPRYGPGGAPFQTETSLAGIAGGAEELKATLRRAVGPTESKLRAIREQKGGLRDEVTLLANGQLPFPTTVLNALNQNLPSAGRTPPAQPLCKLCEVTDEGWRAAIEVAFNRKFAIVVSDADYPAALIVYQGLKAESPQESLIHPGKALRLARLVKPGSLAEKLQAEHPIARAIVSNLFGELMCVERNEDLSKHDFAIQKDGFMTRGAFVERRRHYDGMPFVGLRGLEKQLVLKRGLLADIESQERQLAPVVNAVQGIMDRAAEFIPAQPLKKK